METNTPHEDVNAATAALVRQATEAAGRTRNWVSEQTGISSTTLFRRWDGRTPYTVVELALIARALDVHLSTLVPAKAHQDAA